ncbi:MAG: mechanosensitive ion channel domain-containing protein [Crocinitomicaceae bacterium]
MPINDSTIEILSLIDTATESNIVKTEPTIIVVRDTIFQSTAIPNSKKVDIVDQSIDLNISPLIIIALVGLGIALYFLMAFLKKYILPVFIQRYQKLNIKLFWFRFSSIVWLIFGLLALYIFIKGSVVVTSLVIITVGAVFHNFIFDYMLGIFFQFENNIKRFVQFRLGNIEGEVHSFETRHLKILDKQGEEVYIPYRNLLNEPVRIIKQVDSFIEKSFEIEIEGDSSQTSQLLRKYMTICPWIKDSNSYQINYLKENKYLISVRVKEAFTANKIETFVQSKIK